MSTLFTVFSLIKKYLFTPRRLFRSFDELLQTCYSFVICKNSTVQDDNGRRKKEGG